MANVCCKLIYDYIFGSLGPFFYLGREIGSLFIEFLSLLCPLQLSQCTSHIEHDIEIRRREGECPLPLSQCIIMTARF